MLLPPGSGHLSVGVAANRISYGAYLDYQQRLKKSMSLFAQAQAGMTYGGQPDFGVMGGLRWEW